MVEVDATLPLTGPNGRLTLLDAFEGRRQLIACYFMWWDGHPAAEQCEGCTWVTTQVAELSYLHSRHITFAVLCQGPYYESIRYRDFMGWNLPWYSAQASRDTLLTGRQVGLFHLVCYLRDGDRVYETYWTTGRGAEVMDNNYALMDLTVFGRQEAWEDSPAGWPPSGRESTPAAPTTSASVNRPLVTPDQRAQRVRQFRRVHHREVRPQHPHIQREHLRMIRTRLERTPLRA
jgi:predicted dithiol-disulfide oxidoreductase (DUF899 family)